MPVADQNLDTLLIGFVSRDPVALDQFPRKAKPLVKQLARRWGYDLSCDLHEEVVQETFLTLLGGKITPFKPTRGTVPAYLSGVVRNAVQRVKASYCPPGMRTRSLNGDAGGARPFCLDEARDYPTHLNVDAMHAVWDLFREASTLVASAVVAIFWVGITVAETARNLGVNRFKLRRELRTFLTPHCPSTARARSGLHRPRARVCMFRLN